ncbi:L,D-transpeptidase family protein [Jannaschia pohangensis]|uniref:L,D-transpeptidase catalytic domain n=1 Tax=Jannaschia pohangensis TaxID=390807 RepID=A0A1I3R2J3_9RHOB|nr:L,D-transpeptidase family protein [Jannaschia pohangensis]SFJ39919.1 L,D-transpeptidase catalytic domain [Jannaschia pohangensis]
MKRLLLTLAFIALAVPTYTAVMARLDLVTAPPMAPEDQQADRVHVDKSDRILTLLRDGAPIATYEISLGSNGDDGHKQREGDERTPEGQYVIDWRNDGSFAHLSLHISYPNAEDIARAQAAGDDPGGLIMIHGIANGWGWLGALQTAWDWTDGCIAVTNAEMRDIWSRVPNGTPIEIDA